ncbi:MAG: molybdopterin molybdotransferase MoeA [Bacteroidota bacterium]
MITVEEASRIISDHIHDYGTETVSLHQAIGRTLREEVHADRELPPFNRSTRDGIAIAYAAYTTGERHFPVKGIAPAGSPQISLTDPATCIEVMTGAVIPEGTDTVLMYEEIEIKDGVATIKTSEVNKGQHIHYQGEDRQTGDLIIRPGTRISPAEIGVCASVGKHQVAVAKLPSMMIISSGDELVEVDETPLPHQIRRSNVYGLSASFIHMGMQVDQHHLTDDMDEILRELGNILDTYDILILSGGVSKGKFDFLPEALSRLGVEKYFHRVRQRPGKPFWFGKRENTLVFALPGNPVSSFMCTQRYILPWLYASIGTAPAKPLFANLKAPIPFKPELTYFAQVVLESDEYGTLWALPMEGHGSGDLANLVDTDAFIELPMGKHLYEEGEVFRVFRYR